MTIRLKRPIKFAKIIKTIKKARIQYEIITDGAATLGYAFPRTYLKFSIDGGADDIYIGFMRFNPKNQTESEIDYNDYHGYASTPLDELTPYNLVSQHGKLNINLNKKVYKIFVIPKDEETTEVRLCDDNNVSLASFRADNIRAHSQTTQAATRPATSE